MTNSPSPTPVKCPIYECDKSVNKYGQCYTRNQSTNITYISDCAVNASEFIICQVDEQEDRGYCSYRLGYYENAAAGEKCLITEYCRDYDNGANCIDGYCYNKQPYETCRSTLDCPEGFWCQAILDLGSRCQLSRRYGGLCDSDYDCQVGTLCQIFKKTPRNNNCRELFSLQSGEEVGNCASMGFKHFLCKSGMCYQGPNDDTGTCIDALEVLNDEPCQTDFDCATSTDAMSGNRLYTSCQCANDDTGLAYCSRSIGNEEWQYYLKAYFNVTLLGGFRQCNAANIEGYPCILPLIDYFDEKIKYMEAKELAYNWPSVHKNTQCILNALNHAYWQVLYSKYGNSEQDDLFSGAKTLTLGILLNLFL